MTNISLEKYRPVKYQKTIIWKTYVILYIGLKFDFPQLKGWATDPNVGQQRASLVIIITPSLSTFDIWWPVVLCCTYKSREWWHAVSRVASKGNSTSAITQDNEAHLCFESARSLFRERKYQNTSFFARCGPWVSPTLLFTHFLVSDGLIS